MMPAAPKATAQVMPMLNSTIQALTAMPTAYMRAAQATALTRVFTSGNIFAPHLEITDIVLCAKRETQGTTV